MLPSARLIANHRLAKSITWPILSRKLSTTKSKLSGHGIDPRLLKVGFKPTTQYQREFAARKYNLIPEDYETYEDHPFGDYPKLPNHSLNDDRYGRYDDPEMLRYFGYPIPVDIDLYTPGRLAEGLGTPEPLWKQTLVFCTVIAIPLCYFYLMDHFDVRNTRNYKHEPKYGFHLTNVVHHDFPESKSHH